MILLSNEISHLQQDLFLYNVNVSITNHIDKSQLLMIIIKVFEFSIFLIPLKKL